MNLSGDEADALFGDDRGDEIDDVSLTRWLTIERSKDGVVIETENDTHDLTQKEVEEMKDQFGWDSIWWAISEKTKCLRYVRRHG